jgi:hypothetical protein
MHGFTAHKEQLTDDGFTILDHIYTEEETTRIIEAIEQVNGTNEKFRKSADLFAIRQFLKEVNVIDLLFNENLKTVIRGLAGNNYFLVKSIYFDKPELSNWFVAFHQDLTISVDKKVDLGNFGPWTTKQDQFAVQPPVKFLENIVTIRIHLDNTNAENGALKVIPGSHHKGICRIEQMEKNREEKVCEVNKGGIMIMKPLLFHSSGRSTGNSKRRVIHLEFSNLNLPGGINWSEKIELPVS